MGFLDGEVDSSYNDQLTGLIADAPSDNFEIPDAQGDAIDQYDSGMEGFMNLLSGAGNDSSAQDSRSVPLPEMKPIDDNGLISQVANTPLQVQGEGAMNQITNLWKSFFGSSSDKNSGSILGKSGGAIILGSILQGVFSAPLTKAKAKESEANIGLINARTNTESLQQQALRNKQAGVGVRDPNAQGVSLSTFQPLNRKPVDYFAKG